MSTRKHVCKITLPQALSDRYFVKFCAAQVPNARICVNYHGLKCVFLDGSQSYP